MPELNEEINNKSDLLDPLNLNKKEKSKSSLILNVILVICFLLISSYYVFSSPQRERDVIVHVSKSDSLSEIVNELESKNIVKYPMVLKWFVFFISSDKHISSGDYLFKKDETFWNVAWQLGRSIHGVDRIKITFKEGVTNNEIASILGDKITSFRKDLFLSDERSKQGYLFPDTYFFYPMSTTDEIINEFSSNFKNKILSLDKKIKNSKRSLSDIIIMASIIEKEASGKNDSGIISGILWKRVNLGMLLQVDAAPSTYDDLGLPDAPICNPGIASILAALSPVESQYLFYLHDDFGNVHYAKDFSEHRSNIAKYLK